VKFFQPREQKVNSTHRVFNFIFFRYTPFISLLKKEYWQQTNEQNTWRPRRQNGNEFRKMAYLYWRRLLTLFASGCVSPHTLFPSGFPSPRTHFTSGCVSPQTGLAIAIVATNWAALLEIIL